MATPNPSAIPAGKPPPGVVPNFEHPQSQAKIFFIEGSILFFVMLVLLGVRIYVKIRVLRKASWDDLTCALAAVGTVYYYIAVSVAITLGKIGIHIWDISLAFLTSKKFLVPAYLVDAWPTLVFLLTKLTFMLLYLQIFGPMRWLRCGCYIGITVMTLFYVPFWIVQVYFSTPENGQSWPQDFESTRYANATRVAIPLTTLSFVFDVYIFVLPIVAVLRLQMSRRRKLAVIAMFISGFTAVLASALSLVYRVKYSSTDSTYSAFPVQVTAFTEMAVGVSVSCMPATSVFFRNLSSTYLRTETVTNQPILTREANMSSNIRRRKRIFGFSRGTRLNMGESQSDLTRDTILELDKRKTVETIVDGGPPPHGMPENEVHYSTHMQAYSESRESNAVSEAKADDSPC